MTATTKNVKRIVLVIAAVIVVVVALVAGIIFWQSHNRPGPTADPHTTQIEELKLRGIKNVQYVQDNRISYMQDNKAIDSNVKLFYGEIGNDHTACRVRIHQDEQGLYAIIVNDYKIVDPTEALLRKDPQLKDCFTDDSKATPDETSGG